MNEHKDAVAARVAENIEAIHAVQARVEERLSGHQLFIERLTGALARPRTTYLFVAAIVGWAIFNEVSGKSIDPAPFFWLQGVVGVIAVLMTTLVLTTQRIQGSAELRRKADQNDIGHQDCRQIRQQTRFRPQV